VVWPLLDSVPPHPGDLSFVARIPLFLFRPHRRLLFALVSYEGDVVSTEDDDRELGFWMEWVPLILLLLLVLGLIYLLWRFI
jgi:hypothetical protein